MNNLSCALQILTRVSLFIIKAILSFRIQMYLLWNVFVMFYVNLLKYLVHIFVELQNFFSVLRTFILM